MRETRRTLQGTRGALGPGSGDGKFLRPLVTEPPSHLNYQGVGWVEDGRILREMGSTLNFSMRTGYGTKE